MIGLAHHLAAAATLLVGAFGASRPGRDKDRVAGRRRKTATGMAAMLVTGAGALQAQGLKDVQIADIDQRFEVATKDFGDGTVMMTSASPVGDAWSYQTHQFDCVDKTYAALPATSELPTEFPDPISPQQTNAFGEEDEVAPLAQHACTKHGQPLLEW
ncbi:hypothetical protein [Marinibacterium sp. SX1]|uniref:hypothetical protein n=1 Tax=Marinibacterium sp. SX1 TaxID=3388424 RepID=UPI003D17393F